MLELKQKDWLGWKCFSNQNSRKNTFQGFSHLRLFSGLTTIESRWPQRLCWTLVQKHNTRLTMTYAVTQEAPEFQEICEFQGLLWNSVSFAHFLKTNVIKVLKGSEKGAILLPLEDPLENFHRIQPLCSVFYRFFLQHIESKCSYLQIIVYYFW